MNKESKAILGQWRNNRLYFSDHEKKMIIEDYLSGNECKQSGYSRYTGYPGANGKIIMWMRKFGIEDKVRKTSNFVRMPKQNRVRLPTTDDFETLKHKKRIAELEKQLQTAEMKAIAFSTMVDVAEKDFSIPIRKKHYTKL